MKQMLMLLPNADLHEEIMALVDTLPDVEGTLVMHFDEAINAVVSKTFDFAILDNDHLELNSVDWLVAIAGLGYELPVIVLDDANASAKSALTAFRLGVVDYLTRPLDMQHLWMTIAHHIAVSAVQPARTLDACPIPPRNNLDDDLALRPTVLRLTHQQFQEVTCTLTNLQMQLKAQLVVLNDEQQNIIAAAGDLQAYELLAFRGITSIELQINPHLASAFSDEVFHTAYLEGDHTTVYVISNPVGIPFSLITICDESVKTGMIWTTCRHAMHTLYHSLHGQGQSQQGSVMDAAAV